jgi:hypothetical protein
MDYFAGLDVSVKETRGSDIDTGVVDSLKALDPERPIREADIVDVSQVPKPAVSNRSKAPLFDHLVGARERCRRDQSRRTHPTFHAAPRTPTLSRNRILSGRSTT